ncbi:PepSY domain-containing protein [Arenimonas sp. MALMAid1274]|uniref:PepSY domain-containing protein n=1 Tax=Arenimonas sp. MALMAid1274 TaxID=3411630 RepID=UPI003B9F38B0
MFKNAIFQIHWFLGITAGLVLAVVGVTGAMLSFEHDLLKAMNAGVMTVPVQGRTPLAPEELLARIARAEPGKTISSITLPAEAGDSARVGFAPVQGAPTGPGGRARGESRYVDPYTGDLLGTPRGEGFFRTTMQIHRWLAADEVGKQIVGASTVALVFFCLSGLYLRWPRKWLDWRAWLRLDWAQRGRSFLWHLHSVVGTWVVLAYLVMALTGLFWSYDWYRSGLYSITGTPVPAQRGGPPPAGAGAAGERQRGSGALQADPRGGGASRGQGAVTAPDVAAAFGAFNRIVPAHSSLTLRLPGSPGQPLEFSYQDPDPPHERANNRLTLDAATLAVREHERYDDKPAGQKLMASIFPLHSGSFFGLPGLLLFGLASLAMPLFTITGWLLYLDRRRKKQAAARAADLLAPASVAPAVAGAATDLVIAYASQTGTAEGLAWQTASSLQAAGLRVQVVALSTLDAEALARVPRLLVVASTFGEGEPPDAVRRFAKRVLAQPAALSGLRFGLLALGDRSYAHFCGFARDLEHWLRQHGAVPLFDTVQVDNGDAGALRHWQHHLGLLAGRTDLPDWSPPRYEAWRLVERELLNEGSPGGAVYRVALSPPAAGAHWQAGDIAEIGPRLAPAEVSTFLAASGHDAGATVSLHGQPLPLRDALAGCVLPDPASVRGLSPQALVDGLAALPHREYSIASLPSEGRIELLVRQMHRPDGRLGLGSAWLTRHALPQAGIALRLRSNPSFHAPADDRPLVLVGNGTGIAGLLGLLKSRVAAGHRRNWLLFGERCAAHDFHFGAEIEAMQAAGFLEHLDLAFSRDTPDRVYVQQRLREQLPRLRAWLAQGATVMVCGSLEGMAPGVESVLIEAIGPEALDQLAETHRYRRDVY